MVSRGEQIKHLCLQGIGTNKKTEKDDVFKEILKIMKFSFKKDEVKIKENKNESE